MSYLANSLQIPLWLADNHHQMIFSSTLTTLI